jgi:hypothetical protein
MRLQILSVSSCKIRADFDQWFSATNCLNT